MSQVANTFWDERIERVGAAVRDSAVTKRRVRTRRLTDAVILTIILAASATCFSVYTRARAELEGALMKHHAAGEKLSDLTIKVQKLERDVQQLRTDSRVIELFARQRFGFVRAGDVVIKVVQDPVEGKLSKDGEAGRISRANDGNVTGKNADGGKVSRDGSGSRSGNTVALTTVEKRRAKGSNLTPRASEVYTDASN